MPIIRVKKANKIYETNERGLKHYLKDGYDQIDEKGKIIKRATGGKEVNVAIYNKALDQIDELKKEVADLKAQLEKGKSKEK